MNMREWIKRAAGMAVAVTNPQLRYSNCLFLIAHMRCGSTALANILVSRPEIGGYGESHVKLDGPGALGRLFINVRRRAGWHGAEAMLFDKLLHAHLHEEAPDKFYQARAIFLLREPAATIRSISDMYLSLGRGKLRNIEVAAQYYAGQVAALGACWDRFAPENRFGATYQAMLEDPDAMLAALSAHFRFDPPLENFYRASAFTAEQGDGDPFDAARFSRIEPALAKPAPPLAELDLPPELAAAVQQGFTALKERIAADWPQFAR